MFYIYFQSACIEFSADPFEDEDGARCLSHPYIHTYIYVYMSIFLSIYLSIFLYAFTYLSIIIIYVSIGIFLSNHLSFYLFMKQTRSKTRRSKAPRMRTWSMCGTASQSTINFFT